MITPAEQRIDRALDRISGYGPRFDHLRMYLRAGGFHDAVKSMTDLEAMLDEAVDILENGI
jgi:hypothetical protein